MVSPVAQTATQVGGRSLFYLIKFIFKYSLIFFFVLATLVGSINKGLEEQSFSVFIEDLGQKFLLVTQELYNISQTILTEGLGNDFKTKTLRFTEYFSSFFVIYIWVKIFAFAISISPFSNRSNFFINYGLGFLLFMFIQMIVLAGYSTPQYSEVTKNITLPWRSIYQGIRAFPKAIPFING